MSKLSENKMATTSDPSFKNNKSLVLSILPGVGMGSNGRQLRDFEEQGVFDQPLQAGTSNYSDIIEVPANTFDTAEDQQFFGGYGEFGHVISHTGHSILGDLQQYSEPEDIKNQADVIYNKMIYRVRRGKIRDQMLFYCVYCAYRELNRDVNPVHLGAKFNLTPGEVQRCDSIFSPLQTGYRPPSTNTSSVRYLPEYCRQMDLSDDAISEVVALSQNILRKDPTLSQENPQTVAAGLLRYYIVTNGIVCDDPQRITKVTGRSTVTIEGMFRRIATIDNN